MRGSWAAATENLFVTELTNTSKRNPVTMDARLFETANGSSSSSRGETNGVLWVTRENDNHTGYRAQRALAMKLVGAPLDRTAAGAAGGHGPASR